MHPLLWPAGLTDMKTLSGNSSFSTSSYLHRFDIENKAEEALKYRKFHSKIKIHKITAMIA